ncbi:MAG TPA: hypothetical protein DCS29_00435 [Candidatus Magasanikbacteria bacterium]|nr:hypothetical protein [Candidatus Magasanikbacteria bacterium]
MILGNILHRFRIDKNNASRALFFILLFSLTISLSNDILKCSLCVSTWGKGEEYVPQEAQSVGRKVQQHPSRHHGSEDGGKGVRATVHTVLATQDRGTRSDRTACARWVRPSDRAHLPQGDRNHHDPTVPRQYGMGRLGRLGSRAQPGQRGSLLARDHPGGL